MLLTLAVWFYIFFITFNLGFLFFHSVEGKNLKAKPVELYPLVGLPILMVVLNYFSFFTNIALVPNLILFTGTLLYFLFNFKKIKRSVFFKGSKWLSVSVLVFFVFILLQAVKAPYVTDTGLYHAQTILWFEKYNVVKGLANVHGRFGFNSSYHLATALFSFTKLLGYPLYNALPSFLFFAFSVYALRKIYSKNRAFFDLYFFSGVLLLLLIFYRLWISSPSPDFPNTVYIILVLYFFLEWMRKSEKVYLFLIPLLTFSLLISKVSSMMILIVPLVMLFKLKGKDRGIFFMYSALAGLVIFTPWLVRNVLISGYLIYPFPHLDLFDFKWKVPYELALREKEWVRSFSRAYSYDLKWVKSLSFTEWFAIWWDVKTFVEKAIFITLTVSPFIVLIDYLRKKDKKDNLFRTLYIIAFLGVIYWFYMAPYFRFAHGFIITAFLVTLYLFFRRFKTWLSSATFVTMLVFLVFSLFTRGFEESIVQSLVTPQRPEEVEAVEVDSEGFTLYIPKEGDLCWNHPLPCAPYYDPDLKLIGDKPEEGFYIEKK